MVSSLSPGIGVSVGSEGRGGSPDVAGICAIPMKQISYGFGAYLSPVRTLYVAGITHGAHRLLL